MRLPLTRTYNTVLLIILSKSTNRLLNEPSSVNDGLLDEATVDNDK